MDVFFKEKWDIHKLDLFFLKGKDNTGYAWIIRVRYL